MVILGISAYYHDSAACLLVNGKILAAAQEERFTRIKHDQDFPLRSIDYCLQYANLGPEQIDYVVFYDKPFLKFERLLETFLAFAPRGFWQFSKSLPLWIKEKLFQKKAIIDQLKIHLSQKIDWSKKLLFSEHHLSHAASAFFPSPFNEAAVLTMDGVGEWTTTSLAIGRGSALTIESEIHFPHSLGLLYSAMTYYTGFKVNSGEYKVMGLAPYGEPKYADLIRNHLISICEDGSFSLDMSYFNFCTGMTMTSQKFHDLFGAPPRSPESDLTQREMDLAASIQCVIEEIVVKLAKNIAKKTSIKNLCLAGGVALNCVANGKLHKEKIFENIWIQPAAGDAGGAVGAALAVHYLHLKQEREISDADDAMQGSYLGPAYEQKTIESMLDSVGAVYSSYADEVLIEEVAQLLADGNAIGWHQGRMEFGPRALGGRSILADPRSEKMQKQLNLKVKYRESFRPFAPSILEEKVSEWFEFEGVSPYMLMVAEVAKEKQLSITQEQKMLFGIDQLNIPRSSIPAVTHVDCSSRIHTVSKKTNSRYYELITAFEKKTGCPVLVNTSFNIRGEPIVESPLDAFRCFMGTELDALVVGNAILLKSDQIAQKNADYQHQYVLD